MSYLCKFRALKNTRKFCHEITVPKGLEDLFVQVVFVCFIPPFFVFSFCFCSQKILSGEKNIFFLFVFSSGSGFVITEIGENRTKIDFLVHRDVGGWAPKYIVQESMKNELLHLAHQLSNLDGQKKVLDMQPKEFSSLFDKMLQPQMKGLI